MSEVRLKKGESVEKALRRLKRKLDREGTLREARLRKNYEKPSERKRRKLKTPRINYWGNFSL
ncbi:MAG: 30S ribosomal protein S21 [Verrucomicrobiae bacterium]|nr:30S ribosomal protein S21 [Verrucomicrobiae bacterium]